MKTCLFCARRCLIMLCLWIFLFLTSGTIAQSGKEDDYRCIIPESDIVKNGTFTVSRWLGSTWEEDEQPPAGTKLLSYDLEFECDPGFFLRGNLYVRCVPTQMDDFPECADTCALSDPDCSDQSDGISSNLPDSDECGIVSIARMALARGRTAVPGDVPWQAAIYDKSTSPFMQVCGGSIVSKDVVISAAHCFKLPDEFYTVAVGKIYRPYNNPLDRGAQKSEVLEIRVPPRYRGSVTSFQDDIAAVILVTPIEFSSIIHPVCLHFGADFDEVQLTPGMLGRVAGWGIDSQDGQPSQVLNLAEMPIVDVGTCFMLQDVSFIQYITSDKICAGYTNGTSLCKGDSGGGLAVPHKSGYITRYYLRGIVSTGPPPATLNECNINAVTTFTRVAKHEHFIKSAIAKKPLEDGERRIPPIIPANFINSNQNRIGNNGVNEGIPLKVDPDQQIGIFSKQKPAFGNSRDPQADALGTVLVIPDALTTDGDRNTQVPLIEDAAQTINFTKEIPMIGNIGDSHGPQSNALDSVVVILDTLTTDGDRNTQVPLINDPAQTINFSNERPMIGNFGNSHDPQEDVPGTVAAISDTLTTDGDQNTQVPLRDDPAQTINFIKETPIISNFGNSRDPQADAPGTVVVIPDTLTTDADRNTQVPLKNDPAQTINFIKERTMIGNFDNSHDPQAEVPGNVVVIPDTLTTDGDRNTQVPLIDDAAQTINVIKRRLMIGNFVNSHDPQADTPSTLVDIPDTLTTDEDQNTQVPLRDDPAQTINFIKERPIITNFENSHDPQADARGTVVVIPDTLTTDKDQNTQVPLIDDAAQTNNFVKERPIIGNFGNSHDPQVDASVIPNTLVRDVNVNTEDPLREDSVQPVGLLSSTHDRNVPPVTVANDTETLINTGNKNDEKPLKDSFIPKPIAELNDNDKVLTDLNTNSKPSLDTTRGPTVPLTDKIKVISEGLPTTSPQLHHGAPDYFNYQNWPYIFHTPYQNWHYPSQNVHYPSQNGHYPRRNEHQKPHNGHFGLYWNYNNPVWNWWRK